MSGISRGQEMLALGTRLKCQCNKSLGTSLICDDVTDIKKGHGGHFDFIFKFKPVVETLREEMSVQISLSFVLHAFKTCCDLSQL